jgi:site-specific recombinase
MAWDLTALINAADPAAPLAERHLWLVRLLEWVRHDSGRAGDVDATPAPVLRLRQLCQVLERHDELRVQVQGVLAAVLREADAISLLADYGFAPRASFGSELMQRIRSRLLPATPETNNLAELFPLLFDGKDTAWLERIDAPLLERLAALWPGGPMPWRETLLDALTFLCSNVRAAGFSSPLRLRMSKSALVNKPFRQLAAGADRLREAVAADDALALQREALYLRALLTECRAAADSVADHLEEYGVSLHIVFEVDQLLARTQRIELLLDCLLARPAPPEVLRLLRELTQTLRRRRSVRALLARQGYSLLARQVAERSAETGEHYITRTAPNTATCCARRRRRRGHRRHHLHQVHGGCDRPGGVLDRLLVRRQLRASFVLVMLLHWTVATKQPAMTAPAMAQKLRLIRRDSADNDAARRVLRRRDRAPDPLADGGHRGQPRAMFPAGAGGAVAVAHRVRRAAGGREVGRVRAALDHAAGPDGAVRGLHRRAAVRQLADRRLGGELVRLPPAGQRASPGTRASSSAWARRARSAGRPGGAATSRAGGQCLAGLDAGPGAGAAGLRRLPLEVRHVTLSTGQLARRSVRWGRPVLREAAFWWCVAGIAVTGVLNVGVSFFLAFRVALRAGRMQLGERTVIYRALRRRLWQAPLSFFWPPKSAG